MDPPRLSSLSSLDGPVPHGAPPHGLDDDAAPPSHVWKGRRRRRVAAAGLLVLIMLIGWLAITAPLSKSLEPIAPPQITLLASDGTPIARSGAVVEAPVQTRQLPDHVVQAFLAIEDRRFYTHWGLDARAMVRAVLSNLTTDRTQGASTITQQLAKFTFLTPERSLTRKLREALIALWLEIWLTKDEILERYLSNAYFGDNAYGLRAASLHYFSRQPEKLTPSQAAMLAGLVQAPSRLAPTRSYQAAALRMKTVVEAMEASGYLTANEAAGISPPTLRIRSRSVLPTGTYFADWALPEARKLSDVGYSRQTIVTTLDSRLQAAARRAVRLAPSSAEVALVAMRTNGEVVAMVGGKDYRTSPFNRATQARRPPGSTFKLFVYLAALREGRRPSDRIDNGPILVGAYQPRNASGRYSEAITLEQAFAQSSNVAAVRLLNEVGDRNVIATARNLGVTSPLARGDPSLALGTSGMTLLELTAAYAGVAANNYPVVPRPFKISERNWLQKMFDGRHSFSSQVHDDIERLLRAVVTRGTGRAAALGRPGYGKTGTSQDNRDALFVAYTGDLVVGVWVGKDDNSPLEGTTGSGAPARIWRAFMVQAFGAPAGPKHRANPSGQVEPLDLGDIHTAPLGENTNIRVDGDGLILQGEIGGVPVDMKLDRLQIVEGLNRLRATTEAAPPPDAAEPPP